MPIEQAAALRHFLRQSDLEILKKCRSCPLSAQIRDITDPNQPLHERIERIPIVVFSNRDDQFAILIFDPLRRQRIFQDALAGPALQVSLVQLIREVHERMPLV